jgi:hypothetical protein
VTLITRQPSPAQQTLPLDDSSNALLLRLAFERSGLPERGWTFERAMKCQSVRLCIEHTAQSVAKARARKHRRAVRKPLNHLIT